MQPYPHGSWAPAPVGVPPEPPRKTPWFGILAGLTLIFIALGIIGGLAYYVFHRSASASGPSWADSDSPVPVTSADPWWGARVAPVTVVVFADLEDPASAKLAATLDSLKTLYGPAQLRIVWKSLPIGVHKNARDAAEAMAGVYQLKGATAFWHFESQAFANQATLSSASYETWASESGVDMKNFREGVSHRSWQSKVDDDERLAHTLGVYATPTSFINGMQVPGDQPMMVLQHIIDDELPKAHLALTSGTRGDHIYVTRSKDNFGTSPLPALMSTATATATTTATATATATITPPSTTAVIHNVPVGSSPIRGYRDAYVTLVEFADFQCPFCKRADTTVAALLAKYGADLRLVWKNEPLAFHPRALPAAELALEARDELGDSSFWVVHDDIYASSPTLDDPALEKIARDHSVNISKVRVALLTNKYQTAIDADATLAKKVGATGTPTFFINGVMLTGAQPQSSFETVIDEELKKAKDRVAKGTARARVYDVIMSEATD